ncbi:MULTISPECIES: ParB/RepB/Spo0J family partition protein [unclassified Haematobacter]|uniref:ParB/RepB/Spo0J family partition protein n=1 Tax=unclassified Haematobacter TaxID=2640585 RepID=UPI0025BC9079|nr:MULTISPECIES: ParB/RepB/Spo0J family partition protein [unclassified Haematobacter]
MAEPVTALVLLADLYIHPFNTRSTPPDAEIEALADSIDQMGLLQNLSGYIDPAGRLGGDPTAPETGIGIVAGGRRLRALQLLANRGGTDQASITVPVQFTSDEDTARLWASAENAARQPLHPADEVRAYARMAASGTQPAMIAKAFAVTERHVRQRMTLATLPVAALDALRTDRITLDQAGALTSAQSEEALLAELRRVLTSTWGVSAANIRQNLLPRGISLDDRRVKWLGLDAYRNAGGVIQEDLFTDDTRILDEALLDKLFTDRLEECAERDRGKGYAWVKIHTKDAWIPFDLIEKLARVDLVAVELPEADAAEMEALSEADDLTEEEYARLEELENRAAGDISDEDRAVAGIFLYVDAGGELKTSGPWREKPQASGSDEVATAKVETLPQSLTEDTQRIQRLAIQTALLGKPELVLDLLTVALTAPIWNWQRPLSIGPSLNPIAPEKADATVIDERLTDAVNDGKAMTGRDLSLTHLTDIQAMPKKDRNARLTAALARLFTPVTGDFAASVARLAAADIRKVWTPTAENYFARLPVARLDRIWAELVPDGGPDGDGWLSMKKALKAKDLDRLFRDPDFRSALSLSKDDCKRIDAWVPAEMEWPTPSDQADPQEEAA